MSLLGPRRTLNRNAHQSDRGLPSAVRSMPAVPATASTCLNAGPAADPHGRLRNALDSVLPRGIAESARQANWLAGPSAVNASTNRVCYVPFVDVIRCRR